MIKWYVDATFAVHEDYKSHNGAVMTFVGGAVQSMSEKQKLNTKSSTEAELVGADDAAATILWTKLFIEAQDNPIDENILYQDNKSATLWRRMDVKVLVSVRVLSTFVSSLLPTKWKKETWWSGTVLQARSNVTS